MKIKKFEDFVDKKYEEMTFKELAKAPVSALSGVTEKSAKLLLEAFNIKTVSDLANLRYVKLAQAICVLADTEL